jgi:HlyD family secretion protein
MKRIVGLLVFGIALVVGGSIAYQQGWFFGSPEGAPAVGPATRDVAALGRLEPAGRVIDIGAVPGQRLASLLVEEGQSVVRDAPLAYLDSQTLRQLNLDLLDSQRSEALARASAEEKLADSRIATARLGVEQANAQQLDIKAQQKKVEFLKASLELSKSDLARLKGLDKSLVSDQDREHQALVVEKAQSELFAAQALLDKAERSFDLGVASAKADLVSAEVGKQVAQAAPRESLAKGVELAQVQLKQSVLAAPCDGTILKILVRPGEVLGSTPVMQMANLDKMVAVAEVYETDVKRVSLGQEALISSTAFRAPYDQRGLHGRVVQIGKLVSSSGLKSFDPFAKTDLHVVDVRIELDPADSAVAADFTHLQVDVKLRAPRAAR